LMHFNPSEFSMAFFCLSLVKTEKNVYIAFTDSVVASTGIFKFKETRVVI
jgi:hypothetical protein